MLVQDFLQNSAARTPDKVALVFQERRLTYQEIDAQANRLAQALLDHGVQRGDRVAIYLPNSVEAAVAIFAILKAGGVFSVINHTTKLDKLAYILNDCRATGLVTQARRLGMLGELQSRLPSLKSVVLCGKGADKAVEGQSELMAFEALQQTYPNQ